VIGRWAGEIRQKPIAPMIDSSLALENQKLNYEEPQTTPDGQRIWLSTNKVPLLDAEGNIKGILGTYEDITERKRAEEALRKLATILKTYSVLRMHPLWFGTIIIGSLGSISHFERLTGYTMYDVLVSIRK